MYAAIALAERGEATIDAYRDATIDKAKFGDHYYLDKAPGMTLIATPVAWLVTEATGARSAAYVKDIRDPDFARFIRIRMRLTVALAVAVLTAFAAVLLFDLATGVTGSVAAGLAAALGYALASPVWGWSTTVFGHAPVGALLLIAAWAIWRGTASAIGTGRRRYPLMAGAALGAAVLIEYPAAIEGLAIGVWAIWRTRALAWPARARLFALAAAAGIVALLPLVLYNEIAFGVPFKVGYEGVVGFEGMRQGLFGLTYPKPAVIAQIIAGPTRGLLWVMPALFVAPAGLIRMIRAPGTHPDTRDVGVLAAAIVILVLLYNASYIYWDGGHSTGPRHSVPAIGFLALGLAGQWREAGTRGRGWIAGLIGTGLFLNLAIAASEVTSPYGFGFPVFDPVLTGFFAGAIRDVPGEWWGWPPLLGLIPYLAVALPLLAWMLREAGLQDARRRDRIAAPGATGDFVEHHGEAPA